MPENNKKRKKHSKLMVNLSAMALASLLPANGKAQNLNCIDDLIFGSITACGAAGTVTVRPDNTRALGCVTSIGGPFSRARCTVTQKSPAKAVQISITAGSFTITNGANNMKVTNFNIITNAGGPVATVTANFVNVPIGATLNIGASQAGGNYTGTFGITAVFQ